MEINDFMFKTLNFISNQNVPFRAVNLELLNEQKKTTLAFIPLDIAFIIFSGCAEI